MAIFRAGRNKRLKWDEANDFESILGRNANSISTVIAHAIGHSDGHWIGKFADYEVWRGLGTGANTNLLWLLGNRPGAPPKPELFLDACERSNLLHLTEKLLVRWLAEPAAEMRIDWVAQRLAARGWFPKETNNLPESSRSIFCDTWNRTIVDDSAHDIRLPDHPLRKPDTPRELLVLLAISPHGTPGREPPSIDALVERCAPFAAGHLNVLLSLAESPVDRIQRGIQRLLKNAPGIGEGLKLALGNPSLRSAASAVLILRKSSQDLPALRLLLADANPSMRLGAVQVVGGLADGATANDVAKLTYIEQSDSNVEVRRAAAAAICELASRTKNLGMAELLRSDLAENRMAAIRSCAKSGQPLREIGRMVWIAKFDPDATARSAALELLMASKDPGVAVGLRDLLDHHVVGIRVRVASKILSLSPRDPFTVRAVRSWRVDDFNLKKFVIENGFEATPQGVCEYLALLVGETSDFFRDLILKKVQESKVACPWASLSNEVRSVFRELRFRPDPNASAIELMTRFGWSPQSADDEIWSRLEAGDYAGTLRLAAKNIAILFPSVGRGRHRIPLIRASLSIEQPWVLPVQICYLDSIGDNLRRMPNDLPPAQSALYRSAAERAFRESPNTTGFRLYEIRIPDDLDLCARVASRIVDAIAKDRRRAESAFVVIGEGKRRQPMGEVVIETGNFGNREQLDRFDGTYMPIFDSIPFPLPGFETVSAMLDSLAAR